MLAYAYSPSDDHLGFVLSNKSGSHVFRNHLILDRNLHILPRGAAWGLDSVPTC